MTKTLFVGCDVNSQTNTVCLMDQEGKEMEYPTFPNPLSGAKAFESTHLQLVKEKGFSTLKIATEAPPSSIFIWSTSWLAVRLWAPLTPQSTISTQSLSKTSKKACSDKEKIYKIDAFVIADQLRFGKLPESYESHQPHIPLRGWIHYRFHLPQAISRKKAHFTTHLYLKFSVFYLEKPFASLFEAISFPLEADPTQSEALITEVLSR